MPDTFVTFKKYPQAFLAADVEKLLVINSIPCIVKQASSVLDGNFAGELLKDYEVQINPEDFERAAQLLEAQFADSLEDIPVDYYLLDFTDEELYDVVVTKDEWNEFDYLLAKKLLKERGKPIDETLEKKLRSERLNKLAQPEESGNIGGGIISGYAVYNAKKTLPDGRVVPAYKEADRQKAKSRFVIGVVMLVLAILFAIVKRFLKL